jgi:hypothetical protein
MSRRIDQIRDSQPVMMLAYYTRAESSLFIRLLSAQFTVSLYARDGGFVVAPDWLYIGLLIWEEFRKAAPRPISTAPHQYRARQEAANRATDRQTRFK